MIARFFLLLIDAYRAFLRPVLGARCRFYPSCSDYARQAIVERGALSGAGLAAKRLLHCHPLNPGGYDPVPHGNG